MANGDTNHARKRNIRNYSNLDPLDDLNIDLNVPTYPYKSSSEYAAAVNQWLWQCYNCQYISMTIPYLMSQAAYRAQANNSDSSTDFNRNFPNTFFPNQNFALIQQNRANTASQNPNFHLQSQGTVYLIPSLFKRFLAELIDFCILLVLKVMMTYVLVHLFDLVNLEIDLLKNDKLDYQTAMEVTSEILTLELIHRFAVCVFETILTFKGVVGNGGATPGKTLMGLRIVSCESVVQLDANTIRVYPAGNLGLGWAFVRSFIKNFSYAFILPICFTMYFFQHNRTAYDHMCGSIVVEDFPRRGVRN